MFARSKNLFKKTNSTLNKISKNLKRIKSILNIYLGNKLKYVPSLEESFDGKEQKEQKEQKDQNIEDESHAIIRNVLSLDYVSRFPDINGVYRGTLYTLEELKLYDRMFSGHRKKDEAVRFPLMKWSHKLPHTHASKRITSSIKFRQHQNAIEDIYRRYPALKDLYENEFNYSKVGKYVLFAGGGVQSIIIGKGYHLCDCDLFIYIPLDFGNLDQRIKQANFVVDELQKIIVNYHQQMSNGKIKDPLWDVPDDEYMPSQISVHRKYHTLNIYIKDRADYQIIFRLYSSINEILHGFDIGSCAVGFDGNEIYFTNLSKFSFEYGYNIFDISRMSTSYFHRLAKYKSRGFGIIFPSISKKIDIRTSKISMYKNIKTRLCYTNTGIEKSTHVVSFTAKSSNADYNNRSSLNNEEKLKRILFGDFNLLKIHKCWPSQKANTRYTSDDLEYDFPCENLSFSDWELFGIEYLKNEDDETKFTTNIDDIVELYYSPFPSKLSRWGRRKWTTTRLFECLRIIDKKEFMELVELGINSHEFVHGNIQVDFKKIKNRFMEMIKGRLDLKLKNCIEYLLQNHWITENPGQQGFINVLTSSVKPIFTTNKEFFGDFFVSFGRWVNPECMYVLLVGWKKYINEDNSICLLGKLSKDLFIYILRLCSVCTSFN